MKIIKILLISLCVQFALIVVLQIVVGVQFNRNASKLHYVRNAVAVRKCLPILKHNISDSPDYAWCDEMYNQLVSIKYHNIPGDIRDKKFPLAINAAAMGKNTEKNDDTVLFFSYYYGWNQKASKTDFVSYIQEERVGFVILYDGSLKYIPNGYDIDSLNWGDEN